MSYKMEEAKKVGCLQDQTYSLEHMDRNEPLDSGYFSPNHQCSSCQNLKNPKVNGQGCRSLQHATITFCFDQPPTPKSCPSHASQNKKMHENSRRPKLFRQNLVEYIPKNPAKHDKNRVALLQVMPFLQREEHISNILYPNNFGATPVGMLPITPLITSVRALWLRSNYAYPLSGLLSNGAMYHESQPKNDLNPSPFLPQDYQVADNGTPDIQNGVSHIEHNSYSQQQPAEDTCLNMGAADENGISTSTATIELSRPDKSALYVRRHATKSPVQEASASQPRSQTLLTVLPCKREERDTTDSTARQSSRRQRPSSLHVYHDAVVLGQLGARAGRNNRNSNGFLNRAPAEGCLKVGLQLRKLGDDFEAFVRSDTVPALRTVDSHNAGTGFCVLVRKAILIALRVLLNLDDVYTR